jgi:hypothetical protein
MEGLTMNKLFTFPRSATVAAGSLLALALIGGTAQAITDTIFKYSAPKTGYFTIDSMAMGPDGDVAANDFNISWGVGLTTSSNSCFNTGVNLPTGATITAFVVFYKSAAASDLDVSVFRKKLSDGTLNTIAGQAIADDSDTRVSASVLLSSTPVNLVIDNVHYSYGFGVCLGAGDVFHAARVRYTYTNAGD